MMLNASGCQKRQRILYDGAMESERGLSSPQQVAITTDPTRQRPAASMQANSPPQRQDQFSAFVVPPSGGSMAVIPARSASMAQPTRLGFVGGGGGWGLGLAVFDALGK